MPPEREIKAKAAEVAGPPVSAPLPWGQDRHGPKKVGIPEVDRHLEVIFAKDGRSREIERIDASDSIVSYLEWHKDLDRSAPVEQLRRAFTANSYKTESKLGKRLAYAMGRLGVETPFKLTPLLIGNIYELDKTAACMKGIKAALKSGESDGVDGKRLEMTRMLFGGEVFESGLRFRPPIVEPYLEVLYEAVTRNGADGNPLLDPRRLTADKELIEHLEWTHKDNTDGGAKKAARRLYKAIQPSL